MLFITKNLGIVAGGIVASIAISYLYVFLLKTFPRPMTYAMIILSLGVLAGFTLIGIFTANIGLTIGFGITFLIYLLILLCLKKQLDTGIAILTVATKFLS